MFLCVDGQSRSCSFKSLIGVFLHPLVARVWCPLRQQVLITFSKCCRRRRKTKISIFYRIERASSYWRMFRAIPEGIFIPSKMCLSPSLPCRRWPSGRMGLAVRRLVGDYQRLVCSSDAYDDGAGSSKADKLLAARVWEDVDRTMSPRHTGCSRQFSGSIRGGGGFGCPAHFTEGSRHAVFRYMGG